MVATRNIYISSPERNTGKSTIALGIIDLLVRQGQRVGLYRPVSRVSASADYEANHGAERDHVLEMLLDHDGVDLTYEEAVGITYDDMHADQDAAMSRIVAQYHEIAAKCDSVIILGSDYTDVSGPTELAFNAKIAANLGAPVVLVVSGKRRSDEDIKALTAIGLGELRANHAQPIGVMINQYGGEMPANTPALQADESLPIWVIPDEPFLHAPTVEQLMHAVDGELWLGDEELLGRVATDVVVGAMATKNLLAYLADGKVIITPGDRTDVIISLLAAHAAPSFPSIAALILTGGLLPEGAIGDLVRAMDPHVPIITTKWDTFPVATAAGSVKGLVEAGSTRKIDVARALFENNVDGDDLLARLDVPAPETVTPLMFEYSLIERARADRRRVVLPEGDDDRILKAASTVLARGIADLTILGDEDAVRSRAAELGLDISEATVLSTSDPEHVQRYAEEYTRLRAHKGMTVDRAREIVTDVSYFGTMMVHLGDAHGMVSGAAHTTAHTIRPSFEIIKTAPGISSVSGVFLMCLQDRVLVYGDCAVIPDPTAEQLADVAIASAATAAQFGVQPRIAMLSYSTGESGTGADVDKVRAATALVKERRPDLSVEGPIQYDAAVDAAVAATKLPDSDVAGRATVFVFPDLNTGNNTYKAVQRSAGAVAVGPVLQGLNKPVNDLSRGALVQDIINTVAITAIQAQGR
ncbi:MAG: phosphate acetyltransferase [Promicromonosporaceae bacterium]|nr:phosphate acetyltransferase [Promicromonosporaceae bacterium]